MGGSQLLHSPSETRIAEFPAPLICCNHYWEVSPHLLEFYSSKYGRSTVMTAAEGMRLYRASSWEVLPLCYQELEVEEQRILYP